MTFLHIPLEGWIHISVLLTVLVLAAYPLGLYLARVMDGAPTFLSPFLGPVERAIYGTCGIDPHDGMSAKRYMTALFLFSATGFCGLYALLAMQDFPKLDHPLIFDITASFLTNTNWQSFTPETTLSNDVQRLGLAVQNFLSAATGMAVMAALARGFSRSARADIGNFWADLTRGSLYVLLPLAFLLALFLISQGVVQRFDSTITVTALETSQPRTLAVGPVASQTAIKQLGTNGGGFFAANSAHPFENPTPLSNFVQTFALLLLPAALTIAFGRWVRGIKQGYVYLAAMLILFVPCVLLIASIEQAGNPLLATLGVDQTLGNLEGKELRFGSFDSSMLCTVTSATAGGAPNAALSSFMPLSGFFLLLLILLGEVSFGGVGAGLYAMVAFALFTIFTVGLMIGRTPTYLGKKIGVFEIKMVSLFVLVPPLLALGGTMLAVMTEAGRAAPIAQGPHGFSQILHAFASASTGNGSSMGGIQAGAPFYHIALGTCMLLGRFAPMAIILALAGSLARQNAAEDRTAALQTDTPLFVGMLVFVILIGSMTFLPALALGPLAEHLSMISKGSP